MKTYSLFLQPVARSLFAFVLSIGMLVMATCLAPPLAAQDNGFRVDTDVIEGEDAKPVQRSLTLFYNSVAYNISQDSGELMVVDWKNDRIILLNTPQQIQTTVEISRLRDLLSAAKAQSASTTLVAYVKGAEKVKDADASIEVGDAVMLYEATLQRPSDASRAQAYADQYRQFADATKLLSAFAGPPPFHRLQLNKVVAEKGALPDEITLKLRVGEETVEYKSTLHVIWQLSKKDQNRISDIGEMMARYESLDYREFQKRNVQQIKTSK